MRSIQTMALGGREVARTDPIANARLALTTCCENCDGYAFLARCVPDAFKRDDSEIWTYECVDCDNKMQRSMPAVEFERTRTVR
jgi:hypothetical protein